MSARVKALCGLLSEGSDVATVASVLRQLCVLGEPVHLLASKLMSAARGWDTKELATCIESFTNEWTTKRKGELVRTCINGWTMEPVSEVIMFLADGWKMKAFSQFLTEIIRGWRPEQAGKLLAMMAEGWAPTQVANTIRGCEMGWMAVEWGDYLRALVDRFSVSRIVHVVDETLEGWDTEDVGQAMARLTVGWSDRKVNEVMFHLAKKWDVGRTGRVMRYLIRDEKIDEKNPVVRNIVRDWSSDKKLKDLLVSCNEGPPPLSIMKGKLSHPQNRTGNRAIMPEDLLFGPDDDEKGTRRRLKREKKILEKQKRKEEKELKRAEKKRDKDRRKELAKTLEKCTMAKKSREEEKEEEFESPPLPPSQSGRESPLPPSKDSEYLRNHLERLATSTSKSPQSQQECAVPLSLALPPEGTARHRGSLREELLLNNGSPSGVIPTIKIEAYLRNSTQDNAHGTTPGLTPSLSIPSTRSEEEEMESPTTVSSPESGLLDDDDDDDDTTEHPETVVGQLSILLKTTGWDLTRFADAVRMSMHRWNVGEYAELFDSLYRRVLTVDQVAELTRCVTRGWPVSQMSSILRLTMQGWILEDAMTMVRFVSQGMDPLRRGELVRDTVRDWEAPRVGELVATLTSKWNAGQISEFLSVLIVGWNMQQVTDLIRRVGKGWSFVQWREAIRLLCRNWQIKHIMIFLKFVTTTWPKPQIGEIARVVAYHWRTYKFEELIRDLSEGWSSTDTCDLHAGISLKRKLCIGGVFTVYAANVKPKKLFVWCSMLLDQIHWGSTQGADDSDSLATSAIFDVVKGQVTKAFDNHTVRSSRNCFSIITRRQTLDLEASTESERDEWVHAFAFLESEYKRIHGINTRRASMPPVPAISQSNCTESDGVVHMHPTEVTRTQSTPDASEDFLIPTYHPRSSSMPEVAPPNNPDVLDNTVTRTRSPSPSQMLDRTEAIPTGTRSIKPPSGKIAPLCRRARSKQTDAFLRSLGVTDVGKSQQDQFSSPAV